MKDTFSRFFFISDPGQIETEVRRVSGHIFPGCDFSEISSTLGDIERVYRGEYPGYRESNASYHDLPHTLAVFLAAARLAHGVHLSGVLFSWNCFTIVLHAALFHDIGYIQEESDLEGTGAKYTKVHVRRGIDFMRSYLGKRGYSQGYLEACTRIIEYTDLSFDPARGSGLNSEVRTMGRILGSADLMAQMADEWYLPKLPALYEEFVEGGVAGFSSEYDMLCKTSAFADYVRNRLSGVLGGVSTLVRLHFRERWGIDEDLYNFFMERNIRELEDILSRYGSDYHKALENLSLQKGLSRIC